MTLTGGAGFAMLLGCFNRDGLELIEERCRWAWR